MGIFNFLKPNKNHLNTSKRKREDIGSVEKKESTVAECWSCGKKVYNKNIYSIPDGYYSCKKCFNQYNNNLKESNCKKEAEQIAKEVGAEGKAFYTPDQLNAFLNEQKNKGLDFFDGRWVKKEEIPKLKAIKFDLDNNFKRMSPFEFEHFISKLFKAMGYKTTVTKKTGDYGVDVIAEKDNDKIAIQVKKYNLGNPVGNREVQMLLGAMQKQGVKATHSILITTSHFTIQAKEQAKECAIELWDKNILQNMVRKYLMQIE